MWLGFLAVAVLTAAAYFQCMVERYTAGKGKAWLSRAVLFVIGIALGYVTSKGSGAVLGADALLLFVIGFGLVHVPAAFILFLKHQRRSAKS
jgi:hypothetical protein